MNEAQVAKLMKTLGCTREEAIDIIQADSDIDHGKRVSFDLSVEDEKRAKKYANCDTHKRVKKTVERKPDEEKEAIVAEIAEFFDKKSSFPTENVEIINKNRQIRFSIGENWYEITLVKKNLNKFKPKGE
jgi:hypothetical protein